MDGLTQRRDWEHMELGLRAKASRRGPGLGRPRWWSPSSGSHTARPKLDTSSRDPRLCSISATIPARTMGSPPPPFVTTLADYLVTVQLESAREPHGPAALQPPPAWGPAAGSYTLAGCGQSFEKEFGLLVCWGTDGQPDPDRSR
ncbi:hypothetical protein BU16DRAFT_535285 [Lophium mytilinum]|uniref:Uncharacterized protein n=1 Tax=Lophium mytilinum TaxID=390894 RepID=A0A6A6RAG5_9PEZI|nr:hypothetical protein BU16DRAFT_535285 [Lophium mytilinum]